jgi:hypothetical protein
MIERKPTAQRLKRQDEAVGRKQGLGPGISRIYIGQFCRLPKKNRAVIQYSSLLAHARQMKSQFVQPHYSILPSTSQV